MDTNFYLGIDIGGTKCAVIAGTEQMEILERIQFDTLTRNGSGYALNKLLETASELVQKFTGYDLVAIGISCGGPLDSKRGIILSPLICQVKIISLS